MFSRNIYFIIKTSVAYAILAFMFSIIGIFFPSSVIFVIGNPLEVSSISIEHVVGHIIFGVIVGIASFSLRYVVLGGLFSLLLDADHLLQFLGVEMFLRMAHSLMFGVIAFFIMMIIFGKNNYKLGAISFSAVFAHISYDIFLGGKSSHPFLIPFVLEQINFSGYDWIYFLIMAILFVGIISLIIKNQKQKTNDVIP